MFLPYTKYNMVCEEYFTYIEHEKWNKNEFGGFFKKRPTNDNVKV